MVLCVAGVTNYFSLTENHLKVWLRVFTHPLSRSLFTNTAFKMSHTCGCHLKGNTWKPGDFVPGEISQRKTDQIKDMPTAEDKIKPPGLALLMHFPIWSLLIRVLFLKTSVLLGILLLNHFSLFKFSFLLSVWISILKPQDCICQRDKQHCCLRENVRFLLKRK